MPIHDWSHVDGGLYHHFHLHWIAALSNALNAGLLPPGFTALAEQVAAGPIPDVLTLRSAAQPSSRTAIAGGLAVAAAKPRTRYVQKTSMDPYAAKANRIVVRHPWGQVVAVLDSFPPAKRIAGQLWGRSWRKLSGSSSKGSTC
jgi:hypothetical protein